MKRNKNKVITFILVGAVFLPLVYFGSIIYQKSISKINKQENSIRYSMNLQELDGKVEKGELEKVVFAGGCFWCTEASFSPEYGVVSAVSGFYGGTSNDVSYEDHGNHREVVLVYYNTASTSYKKLLVNYWKHIDPTQEDGQFADVGLSYRTAIYYFNDQQRTLAEESKRILEESRKFADKKIAVEILDGRGYKFFPAEEYHQDYADKNPIRYEYYKQGSGRAGFIHENWDQDRTFDKFLSSREVVTSESTAPDKIEDNQAPWEKFSPAVKQERLGSLDPLQFKVTQKEGTEPPFANEYDKNYSQGIYVDIVSGEPLFLSTDKFDSGTGWPSFVRPIGEDSVKLKTDYFLFYPRTEVRSKIADSHLGHVFDDGPAERGGKRYCMNSAAMKFIPLSDMEKLGYSEYIRLIK